jgi:hypothetical protein
MYLEKLSCYSLLYYNCESLYLGCVRAKERLYDLKKLFSYLSSNCVGDTKLRLCGYLDAGYSEDVDSRWSTT